MTTNKTNQISLTEDEAAVLKDVLESYLGELRMEVSNTEQYDFRLALKRKEAVIKELISRI
jgi:hypothetical protein